MARRRRSGGHRGEPDWAQARRGLRAAFESTSPPGTRIEITRAEFLSGGLYRKGFVAGVELDPDPDARSDGYIALVHDRRSPVSMTEYAAMVRREYEALCWLSERAVDLQIPEPVALVEDPSGPILVESIVVGVPVDRLPRTYPHPVHEIVVEVAAKIHAIPPPPSWTPRDRRAHRLESIAELEGHPRRDACPLRVRELVDAAIAWLGDHLCEPAPGVLLHGDLMGHNLRLDPGEPVGVIDWDSCGVGDPAADLAVIARGLRRPFKVGRGRLLEVYNERSGSAVDAVSVRFFEVAMVAQWVLESEPHVVLEGGLGKRLTKLVQGG